MGTPAYASPEQLGGDDLDVRADVYSVGATVFTLLTGRAPFEGDNAVQVVANAVNQKPKPVGELREGVPRGLERVVARSTLRHWLHDLASELWEATGDQTLPAELSLDHVWVTARGQAVLLDEPWPDVKTPAERVPVGDLAAMYPRAP